MPLQGIYRGRAYHEISGWQSFEPWLSRIERFPQDQICDIAFSLPQEWHNGCDREIGRLVYALAVRRRIVRKLVDDFRRTTSAFPLWREEAA
jgi:hypothetical protein